MTKLCQYAAFKYLKHIFIDEQKYKPLLTVSLVFINKKNPPYPELQVVINLLH